MKQIQFISYLNSLKNKENGSLIESAKKGYLSILETTENNIYDKLNSYIVTLLEKAQQVHIWHFNCKTMSEHTLLQELYEDIEDWADQIAESIMSISNDKINKNSKMEITTFEFSKENVLKLLSDIKVTLQEVCDKLVSQDGLSSILGNAIESIDVYIYKFSHLIQD